MINLKTGLTIRASQSCLLIGYLTFAMQPIKLTNQHYNYNINTHRNSQSTWSGISFFLNHIPPKWNDPWLKWA